MAGYTEKRELRGPAHIRNVSDRIFDIINIAFIGIIGLVCLFPFINVLAKSLSSEAAVVSGRVILWPVDFNGKAYRYIFSSVRFWNSMKNTVIVTVCGVFIKIFPV